MSDFADDMRALKSHRREVREQRAEMNVQLLQEHGIVATQTSQNVFKIASPIGTVMYYPSSNTWQHKAKVCRGDFTSFKNWLAKQKKAP